MRIYGFTISSGQNDSSKMQILSESQIHSEWFKLSLYFNDSFLAEKCVDCTKAATRWLTLRQVRQFHGVRQPRAGPFPG